VCPYEDSLALKESRASVVSPVFNLCLCITTKKNGEMQNIQKFPPKTENPHSIRGGIEFHIHDSNKIPNPERGTALDSVERSFQVESYSYFQSFGD
jgi:hypothetical protein